MTALLTRIPVLFIAHGGGPMPIISPQSHGNLPQALKSIPKNLNITKPAAILVISAHWEESVPTVTSGQNPSLIYDYYGFPPESYELKYPAPGNPQLASKVAQLLRQNGLECREDAKRGFDHGAFIPLLLTHPEPTPRVVQLSLVSSLDPETHIKIGEALAPLRDEGVLIYGSGMSFHNMRVFMQAMGSGGGSRADPKSVEFDNYLSKAVAGGESWEERKNMLINWKQGPHATYCHPREEHLIPLMVAFGASKGDSGTVLHSESLLGAQVSSFAFGGTAIEGENFANASVENEEL